MVFLGRHGAALMRIVDVLFDPRRRIWAKRYATP
jgi:hypothetical protein